MESGGNGKIRLNLGSGVHPVEGWINVDFDSQQERNYPGVQRKFSKPDVVADIRDLPFPDDYADEAMAIHVIEHFYVWEVPPLISEWVRVLKPGGKLIIECPSLSKIIALANVPQVTPQYTYWALYGDPKWKDPSMMHKWAYTPVMLGRVLNDAGLVDVVERPPQFHQPVRDIRMEGIKPERMIKVVK